MRQCNIIILFFLTICLLSMIGGCKDPATPSNECVAMSEYNSVPNMPFTVTLLMTNPAGTQTTIFSRGEPITFTVTVTNVSQSPQYIDTTDCLSPSSMLPVNIAVTDKNGNCVWLYNAAPPATCCMLPVTSGATYQSSPLLPGESITYSSLGLGWNEETSDGKTITPGLYTAKGFVVGVWNTSTTFFTTSTISTSCNNTLPPSVPVKFSFVDPSNAYKDGFCGWSTGALCTTDQDCTASGCSGQVCTSVASGGVMTTCEWRECYDSKAYNVSCACVNNQCIWQ